MTESTDSSARAMTPAAALSDTLQRAVAESATSVVRVASARGHASSGTVWSDEGLIVATHRSTQRGSKLTIRDYREREIPVEVVGRDPATDLVVLRAETELPAIARASADALPHTGALAVALARPGWQIRASLRAIGVVGPGFRTRRGGRLDAWVETDRALPPGFSGGPLIDTEGRMIGLNSRGLVRHADLAIPLATIERVVAELVEHGAIRQGWLGVSLVPVEIPEDHEDHASKTGRRVLVAGLAPNGPAAQAGVCIGDLLTSLAGRDIDGPGALREALRGRAGASTELLVQRAGQVMRFDITPSES